MSRHILLSIAILLSLSASLPIVDAVAAETNAAPPVIGHRGASGYRPEHTIESYTLAINEAQYLAKDYNGDPAKEYQQFFELGVDGLFSDFPDTALAAPEAWRKSMTQ